MYNHAPVDYACPICLAIEGKETEDTWIKQEDIFYRDEFVVGFISSKFIKGNEGHAIVAPIQHTENLYELPVEVGHRIMEVAQRVAAALKQVRKCDGVTVVQNNEPAGDQHAFHYHMHVIPRFTDDHFHEELWQAERSDPADRLTYSDDLRKKLAL